MNLTFLLTSFLFIFLAAAPGRTTFVMIMLASQGKLKNIFIGAAAAFFIQSFISVILGSVLSRLSPFLIELMAGAMFIYFAYSFWAHSKQSIDIKKESTITTKSVFIMVFMAEFGDVSQLAIAATAAKSPSKSAIFILSVLALWIITGIAVLIGHNLKRLSRPELIQKFASGAFLIIGFYLIYTGITNHI